MHSPAPSAPLRVEIGAQTIIDQIQKCRCVPFAQKGTFGLWWHPDHVAHFSELVTGVARKTKIISPVAFYHLLAISPHAVESAKRTSVRNIFFCPFRSE